MPQTFSSDVCPIRDVLHRVTDRWSMLILCTLAKAGTLRFSALKTNIEDISPRMLTLTLRRLEQDGFVSRAVQPTNPPRVEYALTPLGTSLLAPVWEFVRWAKRNRWRVLESRKRKEQANG
jgi:DNA-binding HxlR family transcriptional regulator